MENVTPARHKRTQRDYTLGFKLSDVDQIEKGQMTYKQAQSIYGIQGDEFRRHLDFRVIGEMVDSCHFIYLA